MKISEALIGVSHIFIDTAPVIYFVERNPQFVNLVDPIFERLETEQVAVTLTNNCDAFLTNDLTLKRVTELRILVVSDLQVG